MCSCRSSHFLRKSTIEIGSKPSVVRVAFSSCELISAAIWRAYSRSGPTLGCFRLPFSVYLSYHTFPRSQPCTRPIENEFSDLFRLPLEQLFLTIEIVFPENFPAAKRYKWAFPDLFDFRKLLQQRRLQTQAKPISGESGIRTRGTSFPVQQFSKLSLSTTQPSLLK